MNYGEIKDDLNVHPGLTLQIIVGEELIEWRVDHVSEDKAKIRATERRGSGHWIKPARVISVDLIEATMRISGVPSAMQLQLLAVL